MARTKDYDTHISNLQVEIDNATKKLQTLNEQMATLLKEKEESDVTALYKYIRANNISMKDIVKTFRSDEDTTNENKGKNKNKSARSKSTTTQNRTKKNSVKEFKNTPEKKTRGRKSSEDKIV